MTAYILVTPLRTRAQVGEDGILSAGSTILVTNERATVTYRAQCTVILANEKKYLVLDADLNAALKNAHTVEV